MIKSGEKVFIYTWSQQTEENRSVLCFLDLEAQLSDSGEEAAELSEGGVCDLYAIYKIMKC